MLEQHVTMKEKIIRWKKKRLLDQESDERFILNQTSVTILVEFREECSFVCIRHVYFRRPVEYRIQSDAVKKKPTIRFDYTHSSYY